MACQICWIAASISIEDTIFALTICRCCGPRIETAIRWCRMVACEEDVVIEFVKFETPFRHSAYTSQSGTLIANFLYIYYCCIHTNPCDIWSLFMFNDRCCSKKRTVIIWSNWLEPQFMELTEQWSLEGLVGDSVLKKPDSFITGSRRFI